MSDVTLKRADIVSMIEETKGEALNGVSRNSDAYMLIAAFAEILKCKIMMFSEKEGIDEQT